MKIVMLRVGSIIRFYWRWLYAEHTADPPRIPYEAHSVCKLRVIFLNCSIYSFHIPLAFQDSNMMKW